jgi:hypothetical protein
MRPFFFFRWPNHAPHTTVRSRKLAVNTEHANARWPASFFFFLFAEGLKQKPDRGDLKLAISHNAQERIPLRRCFWEGMSECPGGRMMRTKRTSICSLTICPPHCVCYGKNKRERMFRFVCFSTTCSYCRRIAALRPFLPFPFLVAAFMFLFLCSLIIIPI